MAWNHNDLLDLHFKWVNFIVCNGYLNKGVCLKKVITKGSYSLLNTLASKAFLFYSFKDNVSHISGTQLPDAFSGYLEDQNYFHNNIKMLFTYVSLVLSRYTVEFSTSWNIATHWRRSRYENPVSLIKSAINEICKNVKQCQFSHYEFCFVK